MREIRPSGSVRGADREVRPYRDPLIPMRSSALFAGRAEASDGGPRRQQAAPEDDLQFMVDPSNGGSGKVFLPDILFYRTRLPLVSLRLLRKRHPFIFEACMPLLENSVKIVLRKPNVTKASSFNLIVRGNAKRD